MLSFLVLAILMFILGFALIVDTVAELAQQRRVTWIVLCPLELGRCHEPASQDGEGELMFPRAVLLRPHLVPTPFRLAVLVGALNEVALALPQTS